MIAWLAAVAFAQTEPAALSAWATTGVDALPDASGRTDLRVRQDLALAVRGAWDVDALGGWRVRGTGAPQGVMYRLSASRAFGDAAVTGGRFVRLGTAGFEPIDGLRARFGRTGAVSGDAWVGRLWDAETWRGPQGFVGGAELTFRPVDADGDVSRRLAATAGTETRVIAGLPSQRFAAGGAARGARGEVALADAEVAVPLADGADRGVRGGVSGTLPLRGRSAVRAEARYEALGPASEARREPTDWLTDGGYAIGQASVDQRLGIAHVHASGGPVWRPDSLGGQGRLAGGLAAGPADVGLFAGGATIGKARLFGGGAEAALRAGAAEVRWDAAAWRVALLDGTVADVWETRLSARPGAVRAGPAELLVALDAASGADRTLGAWLRAGGAVTVRTRRAE